MKHTLYITIGIQVESELPIEEVINEFQSESYYNFDSTANVTVINTEYLDTSTQNPL